MATKKKEKDDVVRAAGAAEVPELGDRVEHIISHFKGIVTGVTYWLNGCVRIVVHSEALEKGEPIPAQSFDDKELRVLEKGVVGGENVPKQKTGGPMPTPSRW